MIVPKRTTGEESKAIEEPLKYLESTPPAFKEIADAILILDTGEELPAHRYVWAGRKTGFCLFGVAAWSRRRSLVDICMGLER
jgi:hypothetical protein